MLESFSASYPQARAKFLAAVSEAGGRVIASYANPARGPAGEELLTDVARIGPDGAHRVLLLNSGTHGIEGYCGSGCFTGWLAGGRWRELPAGTAVVMVHAINPHGFAWGRRVNEDNVDLNRNFVDHAGPHPENADYAALAEHINPRAWSPEIVARANGAIAAFYGNPKEDFLPKAIHGGQYINPRGTFFGGNAATWSNRIFREILARLRDDVDALCFIDYHTGNGVFGFCDFFVDDRHAGELARAWFVHCTPIEAVEVKHGHAQSAVPGLLMDAVTEAFADRPVTSCLVEMRTRPLLDHGARAMMGVTRLENWFFQHGDPESAQGREVRAQFREIFYPASPEWRAMALRQSNALIAEALGGLARKG
jgi:hypothetical protein